MAKKTAIFDFFRFSQNCPYDSKEIFYNQVMYVKLQKEQYNIWQQK